MGFCSLEILIKVLLVRVSVTHSLTYRKDCTKCPRLVKHLASSKRSYTKYHCKPVAAFGDANSQLLIVGLAPGLHGANATGRPFTGDHAGILLYEVLYKFGFASLPVSRSSDDTLRLKNCRITNAVKCLPPANKPTAEEIRNCNTYLRNELHLLNSNCVVLALGKIAHNAVLSALDLKLSSFPFVHGNIYELNSHTHLLDSYHCSRYNVQTGRLTRTQFEAVFVKVASILENT